MAKIIVRLYFLLLMVSMLAGVFSCKTEAPKAKDVGIELKKVLKHWVKGRAEGEGNCKESDITWLTWDLPSFERDNWFNFFRENLPSIQQEEAIHINKYCKTGKVVHFKKQFVRHVFLMQNFQNIVSKWIKKRSKTTTMSGVCPERRKLLHEGIRASQISLAEFRSIVKQQPESTKEFEKWHGGKRCLNYKVLITSNFP